MVAATFIDRLGGTIIFPFFSLYIAQKFNVGMTQIGILFGLWSLSGIMGSMIGGALTDKIGRRTMIIVALILSATTSILMGVVNELIIFGVVAIIVGTLADMGGPAQNAMVADLLPEEQRAEGFGILRVVANIAWVIGPMIGGFLANINYLWLFILDAITSSITAAIVYFTLPETKPQSIGQEKQVALMDSIAGYKVISKDKLFMGYVVISMFMVMVYTQMYSTLSVYLNRVHNLSPQIYGYMMSMNAGLVVLFQFLIMRWIKPLPALLVMVGANFLYAIGFGMFGFVSTTWLFFLAMAIVTFGEMLHIPTSQALVARFAPEDMRGRYNAAAGLSWQVPNIFGTFAAGLVMDFINPNLVWRAGGLICLITMLGFLWLHPFAKKRFQKEYISH